MRVAISTMTFSLWSFLSRISGFLRDLFLASFIGTGVISDIFFIALRFPVSFKISFSEETLYSAFIPIYGKLSDSDREEKRHQFTRKILISLLFIFIPLTIIVELFMPNIMSLIAPGINSSEEVELLIQVSRIIFPYLLLIIVCTVLVGSLNADNKFAIGAGLPIIINFSLIGAVLSFPFFGESKIIFLSWSVILAGFIQVFCLFKSVEKSFWRNFFKLDRDFSEVKKFFKLLWPTFSANGLIQINLLFGLFIASFESGAVSYLYYAERVYNLPLVLVGIAIGTVLLPSLSNSLRNDKSNEAIAINNEAFKYTCLSIFPITAILIGLGTEIISILFERGEFDEISTMQTSKALRLYLIGLPALTLIRILNAYFYAIESPKKVLKVTIISVAINLLLVIILFNNFGYLSIPLSLSIASWINVVLLINEHKKSRFFLITKSLRQYFIKYLLFSILIFISLYLINFFNSSAYNDVAFLLTKITLVFFVYIIFLYFFDKELIKKAQSLFVDNSMR